jgi:hypothetical protein
MLRRSRWKRSGRGAVRERGGAEGGVYAGGAAVEKRGDGELELAGVRVGGGGVLGVWGGELARERGLECGGSPSAEARERMGAGALPRACHGGGEVAAAEHDRGSVARERGLQRRWSGLGGCGGAACGGGQQEVACGPPSAAGGAALRRRHRKQRGREEEDTGWTYLQFQKSLGVLL